MFLPLLLIATVASEFVFTGWTFGSYGKWANPENLVYPDSTINAIKSVFIGKMTCSARLLALDKLQTWCTKGEGAATRVVWNSAIDLSNEGVASVDYYDNKPGEIDAMVVWLVGGIEGNPKTIAYNVGYSADPSKGEQKSLSGVF